MVFEKVPAMAPATAFRKESPEVLVVVELLDDDEDDDDDDDDDDDGEVGGDDEEETAGLVTCQSGLGRFMLPLSMACATGMR